MSLPPRLSPSPIPRLSDVKLARRIEALERENVRLERTITRLRADAFRGFQELGVQLLALDERLKALEPPVDPALPPERKVVLVQKGG
jgi:hypothetical protein